MQQKLGFLYMAHRSGNCIGSSLLRRQMVRYGAGFVAIAGGVLVGWQIAPVNALIGPRSDSREDFRHCTSNLIKANVPSEDATSACSRALKPQELQNCVLSVSKESGYQPLDALNACRQVRRPKDMAYCVTGIRRHLKDSVAEEVLDSCRRSLLPVRYSDCVVGLSQGTSGLPPTNALNACIDTGYFPRENDPTDATFIRYPLTTPYPSPEAQPAPMVVPEAPIPTPQSSPAPVRGLY